MADLPALEDYLKKGLEKGFNINYLKETLVNHGHDSSKVDTAANNIMGLQYPDKLRSHLEEVRGSESRGNRFVTGALVIIIVLLLIAAGVMAYSVFSNKQTIKQAQTELEKIQASSAQTGDIVDSIHAQNELLKQKDLTIQEKEKIIEDQVELIEQAHEALENQQQELRELLIDVLNRMIGRINE